MRLFRIGRRRKELVEALSSGRGIYRTTITLQLDAEMQKELESGRKVVIPGEVIEDGQSDPGRHD